MTDSTPRRDTFWWAWLIWTAGFLRTRLPTGRRVARRIRQIPPVLLRLAALTNRTVRELLEMQYQFAEPFIVDSSKIANALGVHATPVEQALADTLATYHHHGQRSTV